jgi:hypothetical protein
LPQFLASLQLTKRRQHKGTTTMNKQQLAEALAKALNVLNSVKGLDELLDSERNAIYDILAMIPEKAMENVDFNNNGTIYAENLIKGR